MAATRSDAVRNRAALLDAAAAVFVRAGVQAPVREVAAEAGVGLATIYRHFPTRADLVAAVYRHQVEACVAAVPDLLTTSRTGYDALVAWIDLFVDFLVTKHGLAFAMQPDAGFDGLHDYFLDRLVPACAELLDAAADQVRVEVKAQQLMHAVGNLCVGGERDDGYDAPAMVQLLLAGLLQPSRQHSRRPR